MRLRVGMCLWHGFESKLLWMYHRSLLGFDNKPMPFVLDFWSSSNYKTENLLFELLLNYFLKVKQISYGVSGCTSASQCANASMSCVSNTCTCPYPQYWNGTICATLSSYGDACSINNGCDQVQNLQCSFTNQTLFVCLCPTYYFWSTEQTKCLGQYLGTKACNTTNECRVDLGLYCDTASTYKCACNSTYYWDTTQLLCGNFCRKEIELYINKFYLLLYWF